MIIQISRFYLDQVLFGLEMETGNRLPNPLPYLAFRKRISFLRMERNQVINFS